MAHTQQNPRSRDHRTSVAQYIRMSTEQQQYSTDNQSDAISSYAHEHGMTIVKTYADERVASPPRTGQACGK